MSNKTMPSRLRQSLLVSFVVVAGAISVSGQTPRPTPDTTPNELLRPTSIRERQMVMRQMELEAARPRTAEEEKLALEQIADDYSKIQAINNKMMSVTMRATAPDYNFVGETIAEIRKRANRLKLNLRLPKPEPEKNKQPQNAQATDVQSLKAALLSLDKAIMSFVGNPLFKNPDVVDVQQATRLSIDLETILEFSKSLQRDVERLERSSAKSKP